MNSKLEPWVLVCQGGAGHGAWQAGFIYETRQKDYADFKSCFGTSVGALNCALYLQSLVQGYENVLKKWISIGVSDLICFPNFGDISRIGLVGQKKLIRLIEENIKKNDIENICYSENRYLSVFTSISGSSYPYKFGPYKQCTMAAHDGFSSLHAALLASTAIRFVFPYVQQDIMIHRDGGGEKNNPLESAVGIGYEKVLVLTPDRLKGFTVKRSFFEYIWKIHRQVLRTLIETQVKLKEQEKWETSTFGGYKKQIVYLITPSKNLSFISAFIFSKYKSKELFELGQKDAEIFFSKLRNGEVESYDLSKMTLIKEQ